MFDKKIARSSSVNRDNSPEYFTTKNIFWDASIPGKNSYPAQYNSSRGGDYARPASSLGMTSLCTPPSPAAKYARQRRGSVSVTGGGGYQDNVFGSKFTSCGNYWRSKSIDMSSDYQAKVLLDQYQADIKESTIKLYRDEPSSISSNIWSRTYQQQNNVQYQVPSPALRSRKKLTKTEAFDSVTQFSDVLDSHYKPSNLANAFNGCAQGSLISPPKSRLRHKTLAYGVSKDDLNSAKSALQYSQDQGQGSNEDMKKVLLQLDNTGYFSEVWSMDERVHAFLT